MEEKNLIGVIYPLPKEVILRMINQKKDIFVKFTAHEPTKKTNPKITNKKILFYQSDSNRSIPTSGIITKYEFLLPNEVLSKYGDRIVISKRDFNSYIMDRENKKMLVLHLIKLKKFKSPLITRKPITMSGQFITKENFDKMFENKVKIGGL